MIPNSLSISLTYKCNFLCGHCSVESGPHRSEVLPRGLMVKAIEESVEVSSIRLVAFTGGEPTLFMGQLLEGIGLAHGRGFLTRLVTNAWWARTYEKAKEVVDRFREAGLDELNISYDRFHEPWLAMHGGFNNVINAAKAAREAGITVVVAVLKLLDGPQPEYGTVRARLAEAGLEDVMVMQDAPAVLGRAASLPKDSIPVYELPEVGCINSGSTLTVLPTGDVTYCCGHPIFSRGVAWFYRLGNVAVDPIPRLVEKMRRNALVLALRYAGPVRMLKELGLEEKRFSHICDACYLVARNAQGLNKELLVRLAGLSQAKA